jgi:integrase
MESTYKIFLKTDNKNIDGSNSLYLLFTSKRILKKISLGIKIQTKDWDEKKIQVKKSDPDFFRKNNYIRKYDEKAKKIVDKYFFENKYLSADEFERNFRNKSFGSESFYEFIENEMQSLIIADGTRKDYLKQISKLKSFRPELVFSDIDFKFIQDYEFYLKNGRVNENKKNTRLNSLKFLKQVINKAIKKGVLNDNPFKQIPMERIEGNKEHLTKSEFDILENLLARNELNTNQTKVLSYFLFACYKGLRYSDIYNLRFKDIVPDTIDGIDYKFIEIDMHKTGKPVDIPILPFAEKFLKEGLPNQNVFHVFTNQSTNRHLKDIMKTAKINKQLSFHSARHTLGSTGSDLGMRIEVISSILGHTDLRTTQVYAKVSRRSKIEGLQMME